MQLLPNGDSLVGWGSYGDVSEYNKAGALNFDMLLPSGENSYRTYRFNWSGYPLTSPSLAFAGSKNGQDELAVSWNGETDATMWQLQAGNNSNQLLALGKPYRRSGFQTGIDVKSADKYFRVVALNPAGKTLATSNLVTASH
jgi:hypothetical protein